MVTGTTLDRKGVGRMRPVARSNEMRAAAALGLSVVVLLAGSTANAVGAAQPPGNATWTTLVGTCNGQPAVLLDPKGGNTAFLVGGSVGVGKIFTFVDVETGLVLERTVNGGQGIDASRLFTCEFLIEDVPVPGLPGLRDVRLTVQGLTTPQGPPRG
jgi:hypothetical protein